ncbi:MAG: VOC family protein [Planctomycetota bacterium]
MSVGGVHHVQVTVPIGAETEARAFYLGVLGLQEIPKPASLQGRGGFWIRAGDDEVHIGTEDGVDRAATKAHVAFAVEGLQTWRDVIEAQGLPISESVPFPGFDRFEFRDPFGNRVELIEPIG